MKKNNGFTLIEILIVVAIIGLLASVVLVGLGSFRARGRDARRISDLRETQNALELYYTNHQEYPAADNWNSLSNALVNGGIGVTTISNDPLFPSRTYRYAVTSDRQNYVLTADLEDRNHPALKDDADGNIYGIDCNDPVFCVQF